MDRPTVDNFRFSLPNKLFDYLHAGLPVVCSDLPVAGRFVREHAVGQVAAGADGPEELARNVAMAVEKLAAAPPSAEHLESVAAAHHWAAHEDRLLAAIHAVR